MAGLRGPGLPVGRATTRRANGCTSDTPAAQADQPANAVCTAPDSTAIGEANASPVRLAWASPRLIWAWTRGGCHGTVAPPGGLDADVVARCVTWWALGCQGGPPLLEDPVVDADGDGFASQDDCDDDASDVFPGALEVLCDGIDNDCNPSTADVGDADQDGATCDVDCDDADPTRAPGFAEQCNDGIDNDCDAKTADLLDADDDGVDCTLDCDDTEPLAFPGASEVCADGVDNDCDPSTIDACLFTADFEDGSLDGWVTGDPSATYEIIDDGALGTGKSVRTLGGGEHYDGLMHPLDGLQPSVVTLSVRVSAGSAAGYVVLGDKDAIFDRTAVFFYGYSGAFRFTDGGPSRVAGPIKFGQWQDVRFEFDWTVPNVDIWFDGKLVAEDFPFRGDVAALHELHLYNFRTPDGNSSWDEIVMLP